MSDAPAPAATSTYLVTGQVHPCSAPLPDLTPVVGWAVKPLGLELTVAFTTRGTTLSARVDATAGAGAGDVRNYVVEAIESVTCMLGVYAGVPVRIEFLTLTHPDGTLEILSPVRFSEASTLLTCGVEGLDAARVQWPPLPYVFFDLRHAMDDPANTGMFAYKAIERISRYWGDATSRWRRMRDDLRIGDRSWVSHVQSVADGVRHGHNPLIGAEEGNEARRRAWQVLDRFAHYLNGGAKPLDDAWPLLAEPPTPTPRPTTEQVAEAFVEMLREGCVRVDAPWFLVPVARKTPLVDNAYRERVYCYELYHQLRSLSRHDAWRARIGFDPDSSESFALSGEIDKAGLSASITDAGEKPDLLWHVPGQALNAAIVEVKIATTLTMTGARRDLEKIGCFLTVDGVGYKRGIFLIYGDGDEAKIRRTLGAAAQGMTNASEALARIDILWHRAVGAKPVSLDTVEALD